MELADLGWAWFSQLIQGIFVLHANHPPSGATGLAQVCSSDNNRSAYVEFLLGDR